VSAAVGAFIVSAAIQVAVTFGFALILGISARPTGMSEPPQQLVTGVGATVGLLFYLGMVAFLIGLALTGWVHSRKMGVLSTVAAVLALAIMAAFVVWFLSLTAH